MSIKNKALQTCAFAAALALGAAVAPLAHASDPLPGDDIAPPVNVNIGMFYNEFSDDGAVAPTHGNAYSQHTHISTDILVARYIRTFSLYGHSAGVQAFLPYVNFVGAQEGGVSNIPTPIPGFPAFGPGRANLSSNGGFGQINLSVYDFVVDQPDTGTYLVVSPWISPPVGSYNKSKYLNAAQDAWAYELELGFHKILFGTPSTKNLAVELWSETYGFGDNSNSAYVNQTVSADNIPSIYTNFGITNPLQTSSSTPAKFHEQPEQDIHIYLSYEIDPAIGAFIVPGFYQTFGGKQTYTLKNTLNASSGTILKGTKVDSGNRTNETQLRLALQTFVNPTTQVTLLGEYDVAAHGGPLDRTFLFRIAHFF
jgi:hypothetical protein